MAIGSQYLEIVPEVLVDGFRLGGRFYDDDGAIHYDGSFMQLVGQLGHVRVEQVFHLGERRLLAGAAEQAQQDDPLHLLDVHDIVVLIDGRPELIDELVAQPEELRDYVAAELASLRQVDYFEYVVQDAVAAYGDVANERAAIVAERIDAIITRLRAG